MTRSNPKARGSNRLKRGFLVFGAFLILEIVFVAVGAQMIGLGWGLFKSIQMGLLIALGSLLVIGIGDIL
jgi:hypothetical protein